MKLEGGCREQKIVQVKEEGEEEKKKTLNLSQ